MIALKLFVVLFYLQITSMSVTHCNTTADKMKDVYNAASFTILPTILPSSRRQNTFTNQTSSITTKTILNSHLTFIHISASLEKITQTTVTHASATLMNQSRMRKERSRNSVTQLNGKSRFIQETSRHLSGVNNISSATDIQQSTERLTPDSSTSRFNHWFNTAQPSRQTIYISTQSFLLSNTHNSVSTRQLKSTNTTIAQTAGSVNVQIQAKSGASSHSTIHHSKPLHSAHPGGTEAYQTNIIQNKSIIKSAEISIRMPSSVGDYFTSSTSVEYFSSRKTLPGLPRPTGYPQVKSSNTSASSSTIFNTLQEISFTASKHGGSTMSENRSGFHHSTVGYFSSSNFPHSGVNLTPSLTKYPNISQTVLEKLTKTLSNVAGTVLLSTDRVTTSSYSVIPESGHSTFEMHSLESDYRPSTRQSDKRNSKLKLGPHTTISSIIDHQSMRDYQDKSTTVIQQLPSDESHPSMLMYLLAICLPLAVLLGFVFTYVFLKRSKQDHRLPYSVTVEVASKDPDYEMKRMYSIIDVNAVDINKEFWSGLEGNNPSSSILDIASSKPTT